MIDPRVIEAWSERTGGGSVSLPQSFSGQPLYETQRLSSIAVIGDTLMLGLENHRLLSIFAPSSVNDEGQSLSIETPSGGICELDGWNNLVTRFIEFGSGAIRFSSPWRSLNDAKGSATWKLPTPERNATAAKFAQQVVSTWGAEPAARQISVIGDSIRTRVERESFRGICSVFEIESHLVFDLGAGSWLSVSHPARWVGGKKGASLVGARRITLVRRISVGDSGFAYEGTTWTSALININW